MKHLKEEDQGMKLELSIQMDSNSPMKPTAVQLSLQSYHEENKRSLRPFPYFSDAIAGMSAWKLFSYLPSSNIDNATANYLHQGIHNLDTHFTLFKRSREKLGPLSEVSRKDLTQFGAPLEQGFQEILQDAWSKDVLDLKTLSDLADSISFLEDQLEAPLVYNFSDILSEGARHQWLTLFAFLYNLRALVATDFNAHCFESAFDGIRLDPIADYLPKVEFVVNDSLIMAETERHWNEVRKKHKDSKEALDLFYSQLDQSFRNFAHNSYCLYHALPSDYFHKGSVEEKEERLYQAQLHWLFGTDAGLIYRVREELFGLKEGYNRIFWLDAPTVKPRMAVNLEVSCLLTPDHYTRLSKEAA